MSTDVGASKKKPHSVLQEDHEDGRSRGSDCKPYKTKAFAQFADREGLEDAALREAVRRARDGLIDANLGGGVIKQRIARGAGGRSGGFRTILVLRRGELAFFVHGFAKSDRANLRRKELSGLRSLANE